jgi:hypothetical protein
MHSLYRRPLPEGSIAFGSEQGRSLFGEALAAGSMENYFPLAEQHHTQADPAFCGLGYLVPPAVWDAAPAPVSLELRALLEPERLPPELRAELSVLRQQLSELLACRYDAGA